MLKNIKIKNFGSYKNFDGLKEEIHFKKTNLIYGSNYSGKTTLSRIFKSLMSRKLPDKFFDPSFELIFQSEIITQINVPDHQKNILVFNKDYIKENLSFLIDNNLDSGSIESFSAMIIGFDAISLEREIKSCNESLVMLNGLIDNNANLRDSLIAIIDEQNTLKTNMEKEVKNNNKYKAKEFADEFITEQRVYREDHLKSDIDKILNSNLSFDDKMHLKIKRKISDDHLNNLLKDSKVSVKAKINFNYDYNSLVNKTLECINSINTAISEVIQKNNNQCVLDSDTREWVKKGFFIHKNLPNRVCLFCDKSFDDKFLTTIENKLNHESLKKIAFMDDLLKNLNNKISLFYTFNENLPESDIYIYQVNLESYILLTNKINDEIIKINSFLHNQVKNKLETKKEAIDIIDNLENFSNHFDVFLELCVALEKLFAENNEFTDNIENEQKKLKKIILEDKIISFINESNYLNKLNDISLIKNKLIELGIQEVNISEQIVQYEYNKDSLNKIIDDLNKKRSNEKAASQLINKYLNGFFGHQSLSIKPFEFEKDNVISIKFKVVRGEEDAYHLSEGECMLIAFCYFISQVDDIISQGKIYEYIVFIDDPISSLDSNNVFYIYSLINVILCHQKKYKQLFISTHNLEFFKFLRKLQSNNKKNEDPFGFYFIEKIDNVSSILKMPNYLVKYNTEFNYLFSQIYKCAFANESEFSPDNIYNFSNNMRKFMETYIYFKHPYEHNKSDFRKHFYDPDNNYNYYPLVDRIMNENSHTEEIFDRTMLPVSGVELKTAAQFILKRMEAVDEYQYKVLIKSVEDLIV